MKIKMVSMLTGVEHEREIDVTDDQIAAWQKGELIQNAMSHLSAAEREFIKTGVTEEEWDEQFAIDEGDCDFLGEDLG